jgi:predicted PurR-regulated permease PerM
MLSRLLRIVSLLTCVIAVGWFVGFAVEQSKQGSSHQLAELNGAAPASQTTANGGSASAPAKKSGLREAIDSAFSKLSSPFSGLTNQLSSQWTLHIVDTLLALLIYGFGLGFVARLLRFSNS